MQDYGGIICLFRGAKARITSRGPIVAFKKSASLTAGYQRIYCACAMAVGGLEILQRGPALKGRQRRDPVWVGTSLSYEGQLQDPGPNTRHLDSLKRKRPMTKDDIHHATSQHIQAEHSKQSEPTKLVELVSQKILNNTILMLASPRGRALLPLGDREGTSDMRDWTLVRIYSFFVVKKR